RGDRAAEADREAVDRHAAALGGQEMAQLMDRDDERQHEKERNDVDQGGLDETDHTGLLSRSESGLDRPRPLAPGGAPSHRHPWRGPEHRSFPPTPRPPCPDVRAFPPPWPEYPESRS